jgi:hypothetical protein
LWLLFIAVQLIDVLWSIFALLGIEKVRIVPGITASNALDLYYMPYTHSLLGVLCWSAVAYVVCQITPSLRGVFDPGHSGLLPLDSRLDRAPARSCTL